VQHNPVSELFRAVHALNTRSKLAKQSIDKPVLQPWLEMIFATINIVC